MSLDIKEYQGDFADVYELERRVWSATYGGKEIFPLWDTAFLQWQLGAERGALCPAAYDGARLVGTLFCLPQTLRISETTHRIGLASWCTVDPEYTRKRAVLRLIDALRERHKAADLAFSIAFVTGEKNAIAYRFWWHYARAYPERARFLFEVGFWIKVLTPSRLARATYNRGRG